MIIKDIEELKEEIVFLKKLVNKKEEELTIYYDRLSHAKGFQYILYKNLMNNNPSRAIEKSIEEYNQDKEEKDWISTRTAWRRYSQLKEKNNL